MSRRVHSYIPCKRPPPPRHAWSKNPQMKAKVLHLPDPRRTHAKSLSGEHKHTHSICSFPHMHAEMHIGEQHAKLNIHRQTCTQTGTCIQMQLVSAQYTGSVGICTNPNTNTQEHVLTHTHTLTNEHQCLFSLSVTHTHPKHTIVWMWVQRVHYSLSLGHLMTHTGIFIIEPGCCYLDFLSLLDFRHTITQS